MNSVDEKRRSSLWYATGYIDEYFRLLGGSGCYMGYFDCHVPALFTLAMDEWVGNLHISYEQAVNQLICYQMWSQTDQLPLKVLERVGKYHPTPEDIDLFTVRVTERYPMFYSPYEKENWQRFLEGRGNLSVRKPLMILFDIGRSELLRFPCQEKQNMQGGKHFKVTCWLLAETRGG